MGIYACFAAHGIHVVHKDHILMLTGYIAYNALGAIRTPWVYLRIGNTE